MQRFIKFVSRNSRVPLKFTNVSPAYICPIKYVLSNYNWKNKIILTTFLTFKFKVWNLMCCFS